MSSATRLRKAVPDATSLSNIERLIFSQAVYEFGSNDWSNVSKLLSEHPLTPRPKSFFNPDSCLALYTQLMEGAGLQRSDDAVPRRAEIHLKLAQRHYKARVDELRELIGAEEKNFKDIVAQIDDIRNGLWDDKIIAEISPIPATVPEDELTSPQIEPEAVDETRRTPTRDEEISDGADHSTEVADIQMETVVEPESKVKTPTETTREPSLEINVPEIVQETDELTTPPPAEPRDEGSPQPDAYSKVLENNDGQAVEPIVSPPQSTSVDADVSTETKVQTHDSQNVAPPDVSRTSSVSTANEVDAGKPSPPDVEMETANIGESPIDSPGIEQNMRTEGKRKVSDADDMQIDLHRDSKRAREESQPMEEDEPGASTGPKGRRKIERTERTFQGDSPIVSKKFQTVIGMVHSQISQHRYGNIFHNPIKHSEAPDYHDIVKRPMDLKTIKQRTRDGLISSSLEFQRDVYLMFANAMMYNRPGSNVYNMAEEMMLESEAHINAFRQTEGFHRM